MAVVTGRKCQLPFFGGKFRKSFYNMFFFDDRVPNSRRPLARPLEEDKEHKKGLNLIGLYLGEKKQKKRILS